MLQNTNQPMDPQQQLEAVLTRAGRRQRWLRAWRGFWIGFFIAALVWLAGILVYKFLPVPVAVLPAAGLAGLAVMAAGFISGFRRRMTLLETARWIDRQNRLQERLSTALELGAQSPNSAWRALLLRDLIPHLPKIEPRQLLPLQLPEFARWSVVALVLAACLGFVPEFRTQKQREKEQEKEIVKDTGARLLDLTKRSLEQRRPLLEPTQKALENVAELGDKMAKAQLTRSDALKDLASVTEKMREQARELGRNPAFKSLKEPDRKQTPSGRSPQELQKQIQSLEKALGGQTGGSDAVDKMKQDLQKAKDAAAGLKGNDSEEAKQMREKIAQSLADLSKKAEAMGMSMPELDDAISALASSQIDQVLKDLDAAELKLDKLQAMAQALEKMQKELQEIGKNLAEQLEKGQLNFAAANLEQMVDQLKASKLSSEELQKILKEVSDAIKPADPYGKAGEFLKKAAEQGQAGDKVAAAKSMKEAADELKKIAEQFGDLKDLMASLASLQKAQMCLGNGTKWSLCKTPGKGGRGPGVGTWADDSRFLDPNDVEQAWDNSQFNRPDRDPRGLTERDPTLPEGLTPTKIKGQISPGGPMPSITLKGVSITGRSQVDYKEMTQAAQSEAQSALSQQQIPRAYQGAVKNYFDDLKE